MTLLDRLKSALQSPWLPLAMLLLALSTVFVFRGDRGHFYRCCTHNWISSYHMTIAMNISPEHGFRRFIHRFISEDGDVRYEPYNRFPIGGHLSMKLATLPFGGSPSAQLYAARVLMILFFAAAAVIAYLSLCRLVSNRWIALTATLLSFSAYYLLYYNDVTFTEGMPDFFGVMLAFHGMVVFVQEGRFRQLLIKTCIALLLGWHVFALLLPFVVIGLASDLIRARSGAADSTPPLYYVKLKHAAATLLRSRYLLLGIVALGFGIAVLTFNFTMEYVALGGETPLTEMPSFKSMLGRTGIAPDPRTPDPFVGSGSLRTFLEEQFHRISLLFAPYSLLGSDDVTTENPTWLSKRWDAVIGIALTVACLIGSIFIRPRILFATLASFGFFWNVPMRQTSAFELYEGIYYIGLPLVFFTLVLLLARRLTKRDWVIAVAAVVAVALFAVSSFQMSRMGNAAESAQIARAVEQDLIAIHEFIAGEPVTVLNYWQWDFYSYLLRYYLHQSIHRTRIPSPTDPGLTIVGHHNDTAASLTPQNQHVFLYDTPGLIASYRSTYRSVVSTEPVARDEFDVYVDDGTVYYVKEPCRHEDTQTLFALHVFPEDRDDLPDDRRPYRFDNLDFQFIEHGLMFDGKCMLRVNLPEYDIAGIRTARLRGDGHAWSVAHVIQGPKLVSAYPSIVAGEPIARSEFDVYLDEGKLYYVRETCIIADVQERFFLHIVPADPDDLPDDHEQYGFDKLDFGFDVRGVLFDGKCVAAVPLPEYDIAGFRTGQAGANGAPGWNIAHVVQGPRLISEYPSIVAGEPIARSEFDLYIDEGKLYYVKEPCDSADVQARFFLHVLPADLGDLPDARREYRFDKLDFGFDVRGVLFDGKCVAAVPLPQYDIDGIRTGSHDPDGQEWTVAHVVQGPKLISEYPSIVAGEPIARSEFDLYIDEGKLYYVKEPCSSEDVQAGFFLHVVPADIDDLPDARTEYGFDNLDFGFDVRGVQFDGKCVAAVPLPQYGIARITTGQYDGVDRMWEAELGPDAIE